MEILTKKQQRYRKWYLKNKVRHLEKSKIYRQNNKDKIAEDHEKWVEINREKYNKYYTDRRRNDVNFKLAHHIRKTVNRNINKAGSSTESLGCSIEELKKHLESKWLPGMSWENHTTDGWHIDHIQPLSSFDLSDLEQFKQACHYTNLQPLWCKDNIVKGGYSGT
jgi:hypothetical protein